ncbi:MAG: FMN-binding protein, partial [Pseudomonadota bacterium]
MKPTPPTRPLPLPLARRGLQCWAAIAWLALILFATPATADIAERHPQVKEFFPQADRFGPLEGDPPAAAVYQGEEVIGYAFLTADVLRIPAYSGKPINTLVGFDRSGRITGIAIVHHEEPILAVGITPERLKRFVDQYVGKSVFDRIAVGARREGHVAIDTIAGATITVMVENATVTRAARAVAQSRGLTPPAPPPEPEAPAATQPPPAAAPIEPTPPSRKTPPAAA